MLHTKSLCWGSCPGSLRALTGGPQPAVLCAEVALGVQKGRGVGVSLDRVLGGESHPKDKLRRSAEGLPQGLAKY